MGRAQAALEYLMSYGWAFLVVLVMIGGLHHFGVFNPEMLNPDFCLSSSGFYCEEVTSAADGTAIALPGGANHFGIRITNTHEDMIIDTMSVAEYNKLLLEDPGNTHNSPIHIYDIAYNEISDTNCNPLWPVSTSDFSVGSDNYWKVCFGGDPAQYITCPPATGPGRYEHQFVIPSGVPILLGVECENPPAVGEVIHMQAFIEYVQLGHVFGQKSIIEFKARVR